MRDTLAKRGSLAKEEETHCWPRNRGALAREIEAHSHIKAENRAQLRLKKMHTDRREAGSKRGTLQAKEERPTSQERVHPLADEESHHTGRGETHWPKRGTRTTLTEERGGALHAEERSTTISADRRGQRLSTTDPDGAKSTAEPPNWTFVPSTRRRQSALNSLRQRLNHRPRALMHTGSTRPREMLDMRDY